ncbi:tetratricopeptide repeat protein [bacterium]|nr:tetratricopeptide repeat protein [bacterium]
MRWIAPLFLLVFLVGCSANRELAKEDSDSASRAEALSMPSPEVVDHVIAGSVYEMEGDYLRALNEYHQALLRDSTQAELYHAIAEMYELRGEYDSARLTLFRGVKNFPSDTDLLEHYGELVYQLKRYEEALTIWQKLARLRPDNLEVWANIAAVYERLGRPLDAVESYETLRALDPSKAEMLLGREASLLSGAGQHERAIDTYQRLQQLRPDAHMLPFMIGGLYLELGDTLAADSAFTEASKMQPIEPRYWELRIRLAAIRGDSVEAMSLCDSALIHLADDVQLLSLVGSVFLRYDRFDRAENVLEHAVQVEPQNVDHLVNLGFVYHDRKLWDKAEEVYRRAYEIAPEDPQVLNNFAYMLVEAGRHYEEALDFVTTALEAEPDNASYLDTKGWILHKMNRSDEGLLFLQRALQLDPDNPEILDHLGDVTFTLGRVQQARNYWNTALEKGGDADEIGPKLDR